MKHIEQAIGDLLLRHNCVIVPAFGGFVAEQLSAKIDYDKGIMLPPRKALLFNKQLVSNDGLLINELASRSAVSFDDATKELTALVSEWNYRLKKGERVELDRVGILFLDSDNNLRFEQDRFFNLLLASFGLDQVHFISEKEVQEIKSEPTSINPKMIEPVLVETENDAPVHQLVPKTIAPATSEDLSSSKVVEMLPQRSKKRMWKYVAAACFLPIAFYSIWIPMRTDVLESGVISIKDFNPFYNSVEGSYQMASLGADMAFEKNTEPTLEEQIGDMETLRDVFVYRFTEDIHVIVDITELNSSKEVETVEIASEVTKAPVIQPNSQHFIVGCFSSKVNADNLVNTLKSEGMNAIILDVQGGLHRVSAGAALSDESMSEIRTKAQNLGFQGWILK